MKWARYCVLAAVLAVGGVLMAMDRDARLAVERGFGISDARGGELREIIVTGFYVRENEDEVPEAKEDVRRYLEEGESLAEVFERQFGHLGMGEERYNRGGQQFCRHETNEDTKSAHPVINPALRVRLYDREANVLSEGVLRDEFPKSSDETTYIWKVIAYVPYHENGHSLRLVRLENGGEVVLEELEFHSLEKLIREIERGDFYAYLAATDGCFVSPPIR